MFGSSKRRTSLPSSSSSNPSAGVAQLLPTSTLPSSNISPSFAPASTPSSTATLILLLGLIVTWYILDESHQAIHYTSKYFLMSSSSSAAVLQQQSFSRSLPRPSPSCTCDNTSQHYVSVRPCSGLVNQQYTIAHGALLAAYLGVDLYIEDTGTRTTFQDADYKDSQRLPAHAFYNVPLRIPAIPRSSNTDNERSKFQVNIVGELPSYLQKCTFPVDSFYRRKANMDSSLLYLYDTLETSCGVRIDCSFWGIRIHNEEERQNLITVLRHLQPSVPIRRIVEYITKILEQTTRSSLPQFDTSVDPTVPSLSTGTQLYAAIHLRVEPDMNQGKPLPVPQNSVLQQLRALNIPKGIAIYVASGIAEEIMDQLPEGYQWLNRHDILEKNPELKSIADSLMAEQLALVDLAVCESALYFIGDVRSTFSIASAVTHQMTHVGWYYGSLSMWADNAPLLGLP